MRDGHKGNESETYPHSFNDVVVHGVCYRVHHKESKERGSLEGQWICSRKEWREELGGTVDGGRRDHLRGKERVVVVNKINNETNKARKTELSLFIPINHVTQHQTARPRKNSPPRLRHPGEIQSVPLRQRRLVCLMTTSPQEM